MLLKFMEIIKLSKNFINQNYLLLNKIISSIFPNYDIRRFGEDHEFYLINSDNLFVGFFNIYQKNRIQKFFILPQFQNRGFGSRAVKFILKITNNAYCFVKKNNQKGMKFWEKNKFIKIRDIGNIIEMKYIAT